MTHVLFAGGLMFDGKDFREGLGVLVEGDKVRRVAPLGEFEGYAGRRVDTHGGTLLPGLIDCHVHLVSGGEANLQQVLAALKPAQVAIKCLEHAQNALRGGITALRDCGGRESIEFAVRDACNSGRFLGPTILAAGRVVCMTGGHGHANGRIADGVDEVVKAVREQIHAGCDFVKIMATGGVMTPGVNPEDAHYSFEEISAGIREGHRFHKHSASHAQGTEGILNAVRGGVDSIEHGIYMTDECIDEMKRRGTFLVPTLAAARNIFTSADKGIPAHAVEKTRRVYEFHKASFKAFYEAGGKIAMGTDAGTPFNRHGENAMELKYMVDAGMAPIDALRAATANGAELLRLSDRGRIEEGFAADLLVVAGDPRQGILAAADRANHRMVLKNGITAREAAAEAAVAVAAQ